MCQLRLLKGNDRPRVRNVRRMFDCVWSGIRTDLWTPPRVPS